MTITLFTEKNKSDKLPSIATYYELSGNVTIELEEGDDTYISGPIGEVRDWLQAARNAVRICQEVTPDKTGIFVIDSTLRRKTNEGH